MDNKRIARELLRLAKNISGGNREAVNKKEIANMIKSTGFDKFTSMVYEFAVSKYNSADGVDQKLARDWRKMANYLNKLNFEITTRVQEDSKK